MALCAERSDGMEVKMKKVLIFYASYGGGHLSAANSINEYIKNHYPDVKTQIVDCMKYVNKHLEKLTTTAYKEMAKKSTLGMGNYLLYIPKRSCC